MPEQILPTPPTPENSPEKKPFHRVEWRDSVVEIFDSAPMLDAPTDGAFIYDRSDFQTPIERVQIFIKKVNIEGELGTALEAKIRLDRARDDYLKNSLSGYGLPLLSPFLKDEFRGSDFVPYNRNIDQDLKIEHTIFSNALAVSHEGGSKMLVWIDGQKKLITISNNLTLETVTGSVVKRVVEVHPQVDGTVDHTSIFDGFFKTFMRTMDFTAGLETYKPAINKLSRIYAVGKEISHPQPKKITSKIDIPDLRGSLLYPKKGFHIPEKPFENRPETPEDLSGIDVVDPKISLDDVGGLEQVKKTLRDIAISFKHPEVMEKWGASRPQGVLMYGEPGTGKTMLAQALANEIGAEMWAIQSSDIYEKWLGNSEQHIKLIFNRARQHKGPLILFFDEFDSIVGISENPTSGADNARNAVAGIFKQEMNTLAKDNPTVLVIAATNNLDRIDPSLMRSGRFDHKIYVPMPDLAARLQIITNIAAKSMIQQEMEDFRVFGDDLNISKLASLTDGMSGADITEIFRRLGLARAMQEARTGEQQPPISQAEIEQEIRRFPTNS